ncbi:hypothetical protein ACFQNE_01350 [Gordonia phosphorivorans]|uniref:Mce-associated membrane protein n=1 Tax=Gordonia phosphorivorans TaxID=1056982 RepID=A0ABV6H7Q9_9ACTN
MATAVFAALVVASVAAAVVFGVMFARANAQEKARDSALQAAQLYVQKMFAWDEKTISDNINFMMAHMTGKAKEEYERNVIGERIAELVKEQKSVAKVTDQGSGVVTNTADTATVLLFINQSASSATSAEIQSNPSRILYTMERRNGTWLINDSQLIDDQTLKDVVAERDGTPPPSEGLIPVPAPSTSSEQAPTSTPAPLPTG